MSSIKNKKDAEKIVRDKIKRIVSLGENIDMNSLKEKVDETLQKNTESVQKVMKDTILARGSIIETAIHMENILNEIFLQYYDPIEFDNFKDDFLFKTLGFSQKKDILNRIIKRENLKEKDIVSNKFGANFNEIIEIRNIYAHYPEDVFNDAFYIETSHNQFKSMKELNEKFNSLIKSVFEELTKITTYIVTQKLGED